jgi:conjugative transposon TraN protein
MRAAWLLLGCVLLAPRAAGQQADSAAQKVDSAAQKVVRDTATAAPGRWAEADFGEDAAPRKRRVIVNEDATNITAGGDLFSGYTRAIPYERMIPPYGLQVTFDKTVHIIFPAPIRYVDLGSERLIAGKAGEAENVLRVKSAEEGWRGETNMAVITESGSFYTFNVKYAAEPEKLNVEMQDFTHDGSVVNRPNNSLDIYLKELNNESPRLVRLIMQSIHSNGYRAIKHIGARGFGMQLLLKGIYSYNGMLYFHVEVKNGSPVDYSIDYLTFKIVDRQLAKRTTIQETVLEPVRAYNYVQLIKARKTESIVLAIPVFTVMPEKALQVDLHEKEGGRNFTFSVENADLVRAREFKNFTIN